MTINSNEYRVPPDHKVSLGDWPTGGKPLCKSKKKYHKLLAEHVDDLSVLQRLHYASHRYALLLIFQGMDAGGKDGAIRHVLSGVNSAGCEVFSFKQPSLEMAYPKTTAKRRGELESIRKELGKSSSEK